MLAQIVDAQRVAHSVVFGDRRIEKRRAVLGDVKRDVAVALLYPGQRVGQALRENLPMGFGIGAERLFHRSGAQRVTLVGVSDAAGVVVDAEEVEFAPDQIEVFLRPLGPGIAENFLQLPGVTTEEDRIQILTIHVGVRTFDRCLVLGRIRRRILGLQVHHQTDLMLAFGAVGLHCGAVRAQQVMRGDRRFETAAMPGRELAMQIAAVGDDPWLVERDPVLHAAVERPVHQRCIVSEPVGDVGIQPTAAVIQRRRQIPVEQGRQRLDALAQQLVDQARIKIHTGLIDPALALGQHPRPTDAEAVGVQSELAHQRDVVLEAMVVVAGHVSGVAVVGHSRRVGEPGPDARPGPVCQRRTLDLMRRRGSAP